MKKLVLPLLAVLLFGFSTEDSGITEVERKIAIEHLEKSRDHMMNVLDGLSEEQLNFQEKEESWSIAQCVEHIAISEATFNGLIQQTVATGNNPTLKDSVKLSDDKLVQIIIDRSNKVKTSEAFEPSGKFGSHKATVDAFSKKRAEHIEYVKTTEDDLRNRFNSNLPFGTVDAYQLLLFTAGHTERHVLQMEEVMNSQLFPETDDE